MKTSTRSKGNYLMFERIHLIEGILREGYYPNANTIQKKLRKKWDLNTQFLRFGGMFNLSKKD